eukprot:scaffold10598_cov172-Skeletonema_dohrnii-CCMP3373.AAC.1
MNEVNEARAERPAVERGTRESVAFPERLLVILLTAGVNSLFYPLPPILFETMSCCSADGTQKMKLHVLPVCK